MAWSWIPYAVSAGLNIISSLWGGEDTSQYQLGDVEPLGEMPSLGEPDWGGARQQYETWLRRTMQPMLDPSQTRLEAQRMGVAESGAYMESVSQMEQKYMDVLSRELGLFELKQTEQRTKWQQQKLLLSHEWSRMGALKEREWGEKQELARAGIAQQAGQRRAGMIENIFGSLSGAAMGAYGSYQQSQYNEQMMDILSGLRLGQMGGTGEGGELIDILFNPGQGSAVG